MSSAEKVECPRCGTIVTNLEKHRAWCLAREEKFQHAMRISSSGSEADITKDVDDELAGLRILAAAWARVPPEVRAEALKSLVTSPADLGDGGPGPQKGWVSDVFRAIDAREAMVLAEREECARLVDVLAERCFGLRASMGRDLRALAADIRARTSSAQIDNLVSVERSVEREECAKVADKFANTAAGMAVKADEGPQLDTLCTEANVAQEIAAAIRARQTIIDGKPVKIRRTLVDGKPVKLPDITPCEECHGSGLLFDLTGLITMPCPTCKGTGAS